MFKEAAKHGSLVVILNSDEWLIRKKGYFFQNWQDRAEIIESLECVWRVTAVNDADNTVCEALERWKPEFFANGGDRTSQNTPEMALCEKLGIKLLWGIGGEKYNASSTIAQKAWVERKWGKYKVLDEIGGAKTKRLVVNPHQCTSVQSHNHREEVWTVASGSILALRGDTVHRLDAGQSIFIPAQEKHQIINPNQNEATLIEVQLGSYLCEDDIRRYG